MALDERLRRELERAGRPADPSGVYEELIRRRERRRIARRVEAGALALVVFAATVGGFFALTRVFRETEEPPPIVAPSVSNGLIVFSLPLESGGEHVFGVASDGTALRQMTPDGSAIYHSPDVSPDGSTVVVVHQLESFPEGQSVLATVPITGGSPTWLLEQTGVFLDPAWSPDGTWIAFAGSPGREPNGIHILDVQTGNTTLVPGTDEIEVGDPTWSPDGSRIVFEAWDRTQPEQWDIYSVWLDGTELTNLTNTPHESETWPAWSWANDRIVFVQSGPAEGSMLTMASDGTDLVTVYSGEWIPSSPAWSPDGTLIALPLDTGQVYTIRADGTSASGTGLQPVTGALGEPAWQTLPPGTTIPPVEPTPTPSPDPDTQDIGLGFPVCNVTSVTAHFADPNTVGVAFVATKASDVGGCPTSVGGFQFVAVDVTGDGQADASYGPIECDMACSAYAAPDVDGDGTDELLIQNIQFSIAGLKLYEVRLGAEGPFLFPVTVAPPGTDAFVAGTEPQLWLGGDAGNADAIRCEPYQGGRAFISATSHHPIEGPGDTSVIETTFVLRGGELLVVDVREFTWPVNDDTRPYLETGGCGADLDPFS